MSSLTAVLIAVLQGITELFPVSSLGHAVILPALLGLGIDQGALEFLPFLVVLHLGTAVALLLYFWRDWVGILRGLTGAGGPRRAANLRLLVLVIVATIPAVVLGALFEKKLRLLFATPMIAAAFLMANGVLLFAGERLRRRLAGRDAQDDPARLGWLGALVIGVWQCLAFLPGISRSGATLVGALLAGLNHRAAAHFSFLIATPVILGAAILEIPKLAKAGVPPDMVGVSILGGVVAGFTAYASTAFLMRYFKRHDFQALDPFAWYCGLAGLASIIILALR